MKTQKLLELLKENQNKELVFEYREDEFVGANYHITEVKNTIIKSVDCGARSDAWNETIIQLWESPKEIGKRNFMEAGKALSIFEKVDKIYEMDRESEIKFEYSNDNFHKANLEINNVELTSEKLIIKLFVPQTDCKAKGLNIKTKKELATAEEVACCSGSGCC